jgi:GntR family transcriptional regulator / MocR family aminotransferase
VTYIATDPVQASLLDLAAQPPGPLHERLTRALRGAIRTGKLPRGAVLPPSRTLASDLGVSRWAVTQAYARLVTEGYLEGRTGSATRVRWSPEPGDDRVPQPDRIPRRREPASPPRYDLNSGAPDFRAFPRRKWAEAIRTAAETVPFSQLSYAETGGEPKLRALLAEHLSRSRGADADPDMVYVFTGATSAVAHVCRALYRAGHRQLGVEDPGSCAYWTAARMAGLDLVPLPVDADGLVTDALAGHPELRAVIVGAAHQILFGTPLAPHRRVALLDWARATDGLVIEDDYDAEFTFDPPVLPVIQGSDRRRVALVGSMSRPLTPTVSVGWAVVPPYWADAIGTAFQEPGGPPAVGGPPALTQLALAGFIESGQFARHLHASRQRLRIRRDRLHEALRQHLPATATITVPPAGLHLLVELPAHTDMSALVAALQRNDIDLCDAAGMYLAGVQPNALLQVGYTNLNENLIDEAARLLAQVVRDRI